MVFTVDLRAFETIGLFDRARGDTLWVYGSFNGWQDCPDLNPDLCLMTAVPGEDQFSATLLIQEHSWNGRGSFSCYIADEQDQPRQHQEPLRRLLVLVEGRLGDDRRGRKTQEADDLRVADVRSRAKSDIDAG